MPAIVDAASSLRLAWKLGKDQGSASGDHMHFGSEWLMVARKADYLDHLSDVRGKDRQLKWTVPDATGQHLWRDGQPHDLKPLARPVRK